MVPFMSTNIVTMGLVGCASQKLPRPAPARDLYVYQLFTKASTYVEKTCDRWYVLSAKHGLVRPDDMIEPYDVGLSAGTGDLAPIHEWAAKVCDQLAVELDGSRTCCSSLWQVSGTGRPCFRTRGPTKSP